MYRVGLGDTVGPACSVKSFLFYKEAWMYFSISRQVKWREHGLRTLWGTKLLMATIDRKCSMATLTRDERGRESLTVSGILMQGPHRNKMEILVGSGYPASSTSWQKYPTGWGNSSPFLDTVSMEQP